MKKKVLTIFGLFALTLLVVIVCANPVTFNAQIPTINQILGGNNQLLQSNVVNQPTFPIIEPNSNKSSSVQTSADSTSDDISINTATGYWYTTHGNAAVLDSERSVNCTRVGHNKFGAGFEIKGGKTIFVDVPISAPAQQSTTLPVKFRYVCITFATSTKAQIYGVEIDLGYSGLISYTPVSGWTGQSGLPKTITMNKYYTIPRGSSVNIRLFCKSTAPIGQDKEWVQLNSVGILV